MKQYTDIEQSRKLAEILPIKSADMHYARIEDDDEMRDWTVYLSPFPKICSLYVENLPCWSLAALLNSLPISCDDGHHCLTLINANPYGEIEWICCYEDSKGDWLHECYASNQVDACYEMILKLKEKDLL